MSREIEQAYRRRTQGSARLAARAQRCLPSGVVTDTRHFEPYGIYVERAEGSRKWDVDGNEYLDFFGGHGSLILGHGRREVVDAATAALTRGTQFAANHSWEVRWAERVLELIPEAELVRFTASGTEATQLALRLARAHTGKPGVARIQRHYHGWHDHVAPGYISHFDGTAPVRRAISS